MHNIYDTMDLMKQQTTREDIEHILEMSLQKAGSSFYDQSEQVQNLLVVAFLQGKVEGNKEIREIVNK